MADEVKLSEDQQNAWDSIRSGKNLFVTARAGAGKSFLIEYIKNNFRGRVILTASTGIAANTIGGRTLHSQFLITPHKPDADEAAEKVTSGKRGNALRSARLLIIDEISMVSDALLTCVDNICRIVRGNDKSFGGLQIVVFGDFLQLPPVFKGDTANDKICWDCTCWAEAGIKTLLMTCNFRQAQDEEFAKILNRLRHNQLYGKDIDRIRSRELPAPDSAIRLYSRNDEVDRYNQLKFERLDKNTEHRYVMDSWGCDQYRTDAFLKDSPVQDELVLRLGARVMRLVNKDVEGGYLYNGALGEVVGFSEYGGYPIVRFDCGITETVERSAFIIEEKDDYGRKIELVHIEQVPLRCAWAVTIHKSQGQTFDSVFADCSSVFLFGQVYVAFSRCKSLEGLYVRGFVPNRALSDPYIVGRYCEMEQEAFDKKYGQS